MSDALIEIDPEGFEPRIAQYCEWLRVNQFSEATAHSREHGVKTFAKWCAERGLTRPIEVTRPILERYQRYLYYYRKKNGKPLGATSQLTQLATLKSFFRWLARKNYVLYNPAGELVLPRLPRRLPKHVLSPSEAERVLAVPNVGTPLGLRDRALLETLYSTGMRRMEVAGIKLYDVDPDRGVVMIREGKGKRQRVVPIGARALGWIQRYVDEIRPRLVVPPDEGCVFLSTSGGPMELPRLTDLVKKYVEEASVGKQGAVHLFRHSMATAMLEGGADVRFIQAILGHAKLETTSIYTQVSIKKLKEIHDATHPAERRHKIHAHDKDAGDDPVVAPEP